MTLKQLAKLNGLSLSSAKRYLRAGVDLRDAEAVEAHKSAIRSRRGVGKRSHREPAPVAPEIDLESVICDTHFALVVLRRDNPKLHGEITAILKRTGPVIDAMF